MKTNPLKLGIQEAVRLAIQQHWRLPIDFRVLGQAHRLAALRTGRTPTGDIIYMPTVQRLHNCVPRYWGFSVVDFQGKLLITEPV